MQRPYPNWLALGGVGALLLTLGGVTPAHADRDYDRRLRAVHHDIDVINKDKRRLNDLYHKAADQSYRRDWRRLHKTEDQIERAQLDLDRDRENLKADQQALDAYRDRR